MFDKVKSFPVIGPDNSRKIISSIKYSGFLKKCHKKFHIENSECLKIYLEDSSEIDEEYFDFLPDDSQLYLKKPQDLFISSLVTQFHQFLVHLQERTPNFHEKVQETVKHGDKFLDFISKLKSIEHEATFHEWIQGSNTKFNTKEGVMRNSAETRLRSYYQKIKTQLIELKEHQESVELVLQYFKNELKLNKYHSDYFDRGTSSGWRLCDSEGEFQCQGEYKEPLCKTHHCINPYTTREERIIFSTWNLDHVIEKSRSIIPALKKAILKSDVKNINLDYFYKLMFVTKLNKFKSDGNLKLVHIACHTKTVHNVSCDLNQVYFKPRSSGEKSKDSTDSGVKCKRIKKSLKLDLRSDILKGYNSCKRTSSVMASEIDLNYTPPITRGLARKRARL